MLVYIPETQAQNIKRSPDTEPTNYPHNGNTLLTAGVSIKKEEEEKEKHR